MRTVVLALAIFTLIATSTVPAFAQNGENVKALDPAPAGTAPARDDDTLYSGPYAVNEDGALIHGGDSVYQCRDLVRLGAPAKPGAEASAVNGTTLEPLTREAVELCAKAGFPPEGAILSDSADPGTPETDERDALPATGGLPLSALVAGAAALAALALAAISPKR